MDDAEPEWHVKTRGYKVGCFLAGSTDGAYILSVAYKPRKGAKAKRAASNHHLYRRTWPTREEAELPANVEAFRRFVEGGLGQGGGGARRSDPAALETLLSRGAAATKVAKAMRFAEVSRRRVEAAGGHLVTPKPRGASRFRERLHGRRPPKACWRRRYKPGLAPSEYIGKAKGMKQVLYERGLWKDGMLVEIADDDPKGRDQVTASALACNPNQ